MSISFVKRKLVFIALPPILAVSLSACSGLQRTTGSLPDANVFEALPIIKLGQEKPVQGDYIVHLSASEIITATTTIEGTLFDKTDSKVLQAKLKKDLYMYKNWVSYDKKNWVKDNDAISGNFRVTLPSWDHPKAGEVLIELNTKN